MFELQPRSRANIESRVPCASSATLVLLPTATVSKRRDLSDPAYVPISEIHVPSAGIWCVFSQRQAIGVQMWHDENGTDEAQGTQSIPVIRSLVGAVHPC